MSSPITDAMIWPWIGFVVVVTAGRICFVTDGPIDQLVNRLFLWAIAVLLWYRCSPNDISSPTNQLAMGCTVVTLMYLVGIARVWADNADAATVWRRQRAYNLVALVSALSILIAGAVAGNEGRILDLPLDWAGLVVWTAFGVPAMGTAVFQILVVCRNLRTEGISPLEKFICWCLISGGLAWCGALLSTVVLAAAGWEGRYPHPIVVEVATTNIIISTAFLFAIPLVRLLVARFGLDRDGRLCRRLLPLWRDLTAAVPEIVLSPAAPQRADATARLLRMTVEIRDALLQLGPYLPAAPAVPAAVAAAQGESDWATVTYARRLADAAHARKHGLRPVRSGDAARLPSLANDFDTELRHLLDLARVWSATSFSGSRIGLCSGNGRYSAGMRGLPGSGGRH